MADDEKKRIELKEFRTLEQERWSWTERHIKELEKKVDDLKEYIDATAIILNDDSKNNYKEISELKDDMTKWEKRHQELRDRMLNIKPNNELFIKCLRMQQQIDELKERVEGIFKSIHGISPDEPDIIKEVLRELRTGLKNQLTDKKAHQGLRLHEIIFLESLEKLDAKAKDGEKSVSTPVGFTLKDKEASTDTDSTPSKCEFYNKDYCIPCKSPEKFYECDLVKIGNQIKLDKWKPEDYVLSADGYCRNLNGKTVVETANLEWIFNNSSMKNYGNDNEWIKKRHDFREKYLKEEEK